MLPKIAVPQFDVELPSTGKKIKMRPFLVKEEKILLIASEGKDKHELLDAVKNVLGACIQTPNIDVEKMTLFDIEYLFIMLRVNSVNDRVENVRFKNTVCGTEGCPDEMKLMINLKNTEIIRHPDHKTTIPLDDTIGVVMKYLPSQDVIAIREEEGVSKTEKTFSLLVKSIDKIYDGDTVHSSANLSPKEIRDWLETLPPEMFEKIGTFFATQPRIVNNMKWKCPKCGKETSIPIEGFQSFFV